MSKVIKSEVSSRFAKWAKSYSGYEGGDLNAKVFICGVEWGVNRSDVNFSKNDLEPVNDFPSRDPAKPMTGPHNHYVEKFLTFFDKELAKDLYKPNSGTAKLDLYPIPFKKDEDSLWGIDMFEATGLPLKEQYRVWCQNERFPKLREIITDSKSTGKLVLCGGTKNYRDDFILAFGSADDLFSDQSNTFLFGNHKICEIFDEEDYLLVYFPFDGQTTLVSDEDLQALAKLIRTELFISFVRKSSLEEVQNMIATHKSEINSKGERGISPLMLTAAKTHKPAIITALLDAGAKINDTDKKSKTPLIWAAAENSDPDIINVLLDHKADLKAKDRRGRTALMWAAKSNPNPDIAKALIKAGAELEEKSGSGLTPFMYAARDNKNLDMLEAFVKAGANTNAVNALKQNALMLAAKGNTNPDVIDYLVGKGADVLATDKDGMTALMLASAFNYNPRIVNALIKNKATVNDKSRDGMTPLGFAAKNNPDPEVIDILIKNGANVDEPYEVDGATPLMLAAAFNGNPDIILALLRAGANLKAKDKKGKTVSDYASANPNPAIAKMF